MVCLAIGALVIEEFHDGDAALWISEHWIIGVEQNILDRELLRLELPRGRYQRHTQQRRRSADTARKQHVSTVQISHLGSPF